MTRKLDVYRAMHQQAFMPIFCKDGVDSRRQVEACVAAGCSVIEYTLRKPDAREMIPWIRKTYPELGLLVGSTLDSEKIIRQMRDRHPQLMTLDEIADMDVDGFVSMVGWTEESIRRYAPTHVICPTAMTVREALLQTSWGADFQKLAGSDIPFVKRCRGAAAFDYCPIMVTGGQTCESMGASFQAGAVMVGTGFDLTLKGMGQEPEVAQIAEITRTYLDTAQAEQAKAFPALKAAQSGSNDEWLAALPHWHPFDAEGTYRES